MNEIGKIPPQATDIEEVVLGTILLEKEAARIGLEQIKDPNTFYFPKNITIFKAIQSLAEKFEPIDMLTVTKELIKTNELESVGGAYYISTLTDRVGTGENIEHWIKIIKQSFYLRESIRIGSEMVSKAYESDQNPFELIDSSIIQLMNLYRNGGTSKIEHIYDIALRNLQSIQAIEEGKTIGIPSGFRTLDKITNGWQKGDLVVLAARPGMGKTALIVSICKNIAEKRQHKAGIFSLEMTKEQLALRVQSQMIERSFFDLRSGNLTQADNYNFETLTNKLKDYGIYIDDTPGLTYVQLRSKAVEMVNSFGVDIIFVDYLQLMSGHTKGQNREQEISTISRGLKTMAKELKIPVIALSQLNRAVETRGGDKQPNLSDLRESGAIEQDADIVMFIYRPEYYDIESFNDEPTEGIAYLNIEKHRNGSLANIKMNFDGALMRFTNYENSIPVNTDPPF